MPPVDKLEDYLDLVAAIEDTAATLKLPVIIEGDPPPHDPRLNALKVTPDPGVIEVNLQPAYSWDELVSNTNTLYEEARQTRLGTEKFMLDGRHTGTGGGNHIVIGGATPKDSPMLRRPDLLRSLLAYWHNHPSLSFLFSGLFIGPTSQCPRVDEARNDALYELEIAFKQIPDQASSCSRGSWIASSAICSSIRPATRTARSSASTSFSHPTAARAGSVSSSCARLKCRRTRSMSLAQHLMLRAAIARFWREPYRAPLVRWGTELHDRFMLPHFVWQDFEDVMRDLRDEGYPLQKEWFAPHFEFRFPGIGTMNQRGVDVELRTALEPWHVLGEEGASGGAVRYVDSSLERMQVKVRGLIDTRFHMHLQWPSRAAASDRHRRRIRRGRSLPRVAAAELLAADHRRPCAADF